MMMAGFDFESAILLFHLPLIARDIEDNAIVFHHRYHPGSNQCRIDWRFPGFLMLCQIIEVFLFHQVNYGSQLSFNRAKYIICQKNKIPMFNINRTTKTISFFIDFYLHWLKRMCLSQTNDLFTPLRQTICNKTSKC